jgi:Putative addiction module component
MSDRAEPAAEILSTMDGEPDPDAEQAWALEIARRAERAVDGVSRGEDWEAVHDELMAEILIGTSPG